jgi:DNA-binding transcriptional LysR family regulator
MADLLALFRTFVRIAEAGSFTAVAAQAGSSQPTVSRQIGLLEEHLGARLLQRSTRALSLTDDGRAFYEHARRTIEAADEAVGAVGRRRDRPSGLLRLACAEVFGRLHVIPRLARLRALYPELEVGLSLVDGPTDLVEEGVDVAIRVGPILDPSLVARRIGATRRMVVGRADYFAARGEPGHPRELDRHDCIVYERLTTGANWTFQTPQGPLVVPISGPIRVNTTEGVRATVLSGLGLGYVPTWHFDAAEFEIGRLHSVLTSYTPPPEPISAVYPSRRHLAPKVRAAIDFFTAEFALHPQLNAEELN